MSQKNIWGEEEHELPQKKKKKKKKNTKTRGRKARIYEAEPYGGDDGVAVVWDFTWDFTDWP